MSRWLVAAFLAMVSVSVGARPAIAAQHDALLAPCSWPGLSGDVRCARIDLPEDPRRPKARHLAIQIVVAKATTTQPAPDPFILLAGGPGQAGTDMGTFATDAFSMIRANRDVVLVDYRGTGRSTPLSCALFRTAEQLGGETSYPAVSLRQCRDSLSRVADLTQYTTARIVEDLEQVRRRMRWPAVNVYGTSYGSRVAFEWMRQFPASIRTAIVKAVAPPELAAPMNYAEDGERAYAQLLADCAAQTPCAAAYPTLRADTDTLFARAARGLIVGVTTVGDTVVVHRGAIASAIFAAMQSATERAALPALITAAARGRSAPLANAVLRLRQQLDVMVSTGMHMGIMCSEVVRLDAAVAEREAAGTLFGATRVRTTIDACREWPVIPSTRRAWLPTPLPHPILLVSGANDPNLPPSHAERMLRRLPRGRHVVLQGVAHGWWNVAACGAAFAAQFVEQASTRTLEVSCGAQSSAPPFAIPSR